MFVQLILDQILHYFDGFVDEWNLRYKLSNSRQNQVSTTKFTFVYLEKYCLHIVVQLSAYFDDIDIILISF